MPLRFDSSAFKYLEDVVIGIFDRVYSAVWYWFGKYVIYVKIKENKNVIIAADRWFDKSTFLISAYLVSDRLTIIISVISKQTCCLFV